MIYHNFNGLRVWMDNIKDDDCVEADLYVEGELKLPEEKQAFFGLSFLKISAIRFSGSNSGTLFYDKQENIGIIRVKLRKNLEFTIDFKLEYYIDANELIQNVLGNAMIFNDTSTWIRWAIY